MPIPMWVARANRVGLNRVMRHAAPWVPGFGVLVHRGRRSGRVYRTPLQFFRTDTGYVVALTYGPETDWTRNVLAAGEAEIVLRGKHIRVVAPRVYHDPSRRHIRPLERQVLRLLDASDFLALDIAPEPPTEPPTV